ncbi:MAG: hypothetical protein R3B06_13565 [Kofleriaceae bacterium]
MPQASSLDTVWLYASSPTTAGPHPVVVYAHGQGASTLTNCWTAGPPAYGDVADGMRVADELAAAGYLGIAVYYRNTGEGAPAGGALRFRDHGALDTRALLAAARWGRDVHGAGSAKVAFVGVSMGSFPAFLAATQAPAWADLQAGLDVRAAVIAGMAQNHVANFWRNVGPGLASTVPAERAQAILGVAVALPGPLAVALGVDTLTLADVADGQPLGDRLGASLRPPARRLFEDLLLRTGAELPFAACAGQTLPAACDPGCAQAVALDAFDGLPGLPGLPAWLTDDAVAAATYWAPPGAIDPMSAPPGSALAVLRQQSPVYHDHVMLAPEVLPLLSASDHVVIAQGQAAAELLAARLVALGVTDLATVPRIDRDGAGVCEHGDYFRSARPACGWAATLATLARRFAD